MDNLAHSLVGAALGRAAAGDRVPHAAWIGAVAANAPDWAEFFTGFPWPRAQYLLEHRGVTHALSGVVIEIVVLTTLIAGGLGWWQRRRGTPVTPWAWILACVAATVASHPFMDWQGSYGLRPFLPWSGRWYYGDFVAIADPLYWLVPLATLAWGARRHWLPALATLLIAIPVLYFVQTVDGVAPWLRVACAGIFGVGVVGWVRGWGVAGARRGAAAAVLVLAMYAGAQGGASFAAKAAIQREAIARFGPHAEWAALTIIGQPFTWEAIYANEDSVAGDGWAVPRNLRLPEVRRALESADGRAIAGFARFLAAEVDSSRVYFRDARYQPFGRSGWATVTVTID